ncbi:MAG TPA: lantibiotic dehydratase family protein, partial [Thermoanaerobaculia bacterium]
MSRPEDQAEPPGWSAAGFFLLRTPARPFASLLRWSEPGPEDGAGPEAPPSPEELRRRLRAALDPAFLEALYLASPSLFDGLAHWLADPHGRKGKAVETRLVTFFARMAGRATPFGTFAGVTPGTVGSATALRLRPPHEHRRVTRLQTQLLLSLTTALQSSPEIQRAVCYRPNPTMFSCAGDLRYIETQQNPALAAIRHYHTVRCERTPYLDRLLIWAEGGATRDELAARLAEAEGATLDESAAFVAELIEAQILTPDLEPPLTGASAAASLAEDLCRLGAAGPAGLLRQAQGALAALDRKGLGAAVPEYRRLCRDLARLPLAFAENEVFQVDLVKPAERAELGSAVTAEILRGIEILWRLSSRIASPWERFRAAFVARFGEREVPLLQALDSEAGLELFPSRAIDPELVDSVPGSRPPGGEVAWTAREEHLAGKVARALARGGLEISLDEQDLRVMAAAEPEPLPDCFTVLTTILAPSAAAVDRGQYRYRIDGFGLSADLLGRFCGPDEDLRRHVEDLLRREELSHPEALIADVVHYPAAKADGNVVARPYLGSYEIPYLGRSGAPVEKQIAVSDLVVAVQEGRVVLRSRRLGREVLPRLGTAHKFQEPAFLPVYQFLAGLRQQFLSRL